MENGIKKWETSPFLVDASLELKGTPGLHAPGLGGNNQTMEAGVSHMPGQWRALKVASPGQEDSSWLSPTGDGIGELSVGCMWWGG